MGESEVVSRTTLLCQPISDSMPCGESLRDDASFDQLQEEIRRLDSLTQESIDWPFVVRLAEEILERKSKDLRVASYLAAAYLETEGAEGFIRGLQVLSTLLARYWEQLHPSTKRLSGRISALEWLCRRAVKALDSRHLKIPEAYAKNACDTFEKFESLCRSLESKGLVGELKSQVRSLGENLRDSSRGASISKRAPRGKDTAQEFTVAPRSADEVHTWLRKTSKSAVLYTKQLLEREATDPWVYRVHRLSFWADLRCPDADERKRTAIPGPPVDQTHVYLEARKEEADSTHLARLEVAFSKYPLWLDLSHRIDQTLTCMGAEATSLKQLLRGEVASLLLRQPDLPHLHFRSGVPFASDATKEWLRSLVEATRQPPGRVRRKTPKGLADSDTALQKIVTQCEADVAREGVVHAIERFELARSALPRDGVESRFSWGFALARFCCDHGQLEIALAHLEQLLRWIQIHQLEDWEPSLALKVYQLYVNVIERLPKDNSELSGLFASRTKELRLSVCRLSPSTIAQAEASTRVQPPKN